MLTAGSLALFLIAGGAVARTTASEEFVRALLAEGPHRSQGRRTEMYARLLGDWTVDVVHYDADGMRHTSTGEWHFAWVLEGRAIQDVWISPPRGLRAPGQSTERNRYGTSIRVYDAESDVWHVTWINPVTGVTNSLVGRTGGDALVHEGERPDGSLIRWSFREVTADFFHWVGEVSADGATWRLATEFFGHRDPDAGQVKR